MMTRLESIKEKSDRLRELKSEQLECVHEAMKIAKKGASKYHAVTLKRCFRIFGWAMKAKMIQAQIDVVRSQPIPPSFDNGGTVTPGTMIAMVGGKISGKHASEVILDDPFQSKVLPDPPTA